MYKCLIYIFFLIVLHACVNDKKNKNSKEIEQAIYHFHKGQSLDIQGKSYDALGELLKAEQLSRNSDKFSLKGQICWYKGQLYAKRMDYTNALKMFLSAEENYIAGKKREPLMYTYSQLGELYLKTKHLDNAILYYKKAKDIAIELRNEMLYSPHSESVREKGIKFNKFILSYSTSITEADYLKNNNVDSAILQLDSVYKKYNNGIVFYPDMPFLAKLYLDKGDDRIVKNLLDTFVFWKFPNIQNPDILLLLKDSVFSVTESKDLSKILEMRAIVEERSGNYREAYKYMEEYSKCVDLIERKSRKESIKEAEQQFWGRILEEENYRIKMDNRYLTIIYLLLVVLFSLVILIIYRVYRENIKRKNLQLAEFAETIDNLGKRVSNVEDSKLDLLSELDVHKEKERELKELLENRFLEVRELVRTYYEYGNSKKLQKKVDDLLKLQLSGDNFEVMEQVVNAKNNNVIKKVREMYPNIKEENIKLLNLIYAGFSAQEISVILNDTPQNIYVRKSRLKKSLQNLILQDNRMNFN